MACFITGYKGENKSIAYLSPTVRYCKAVIISQQFFWAQYTDAIRGMGEKNSASHLHNSNLLQCCIDAEAII